MEQYFTGKTVLVTGAGWGIGAAAAMLYAACGANVVVSDSSRKWGKGTVAKIKSQKGFATYIKADVNDAAACSKLIKRTIETYGSIDIACNNSAIFGELPDPEEQGSEASDHGLSLDVQGLRNCMLYEIEAMVRLGGGIIINTSSVMGPIGPASLLPYINAKYGLVALPEDNSGGYPSGGVHINTIAPAVIKTALSNAMMQPKQEGGIKVSSIGRFALEQRVAGLIIWLSSDKKQ